MPTLREALRALAERRAACVTQAGLAQAEIAAIDSEIAEAKELLKGLLDNVAVVSFKQPDSPALAMVAEARQQRDEPAGGADAGDRAEPAAPADAPDLETARIAATLRASDDGHALAPWKVSSRYAASVENTRCERCGKQARICRSFASDAFEWQGGVFTAACLPAAPQQAPDEEQPSETVPSGPDWPALEPLAAAAANRIGHRLGPFDEMQSYAGPWRQAPCVECGALVLIAPSGPDGTYLIGGSATEKKCHGGRGDDAPKDADCRDAARVAVVRKASEAGHSVEWAVTSAPNALLRASCRRCSVAGRAMRQAQAPGYYLTGALFNVRCGEGARPEAERPTSAVTVVDAQERLRRKGIMTEPAGSIALSLLGGRKATR